MKRIILVLFLTFIIANNAIADDHDFYLNFSECITSASYLVLTNESLKSMKGDPAAFACKRESKIIVCDIFFKGNQKPKNMQYEIVIDSPPVLHFQTDNGSEYVAIDTSQHAAAIISRIVDLKLAGAKVCHGMFVTDFEAKEIGPKKSK